MFETIDKDTKIKAKTYLIFTGLILVMTLILSGFSFLARKNWNNQLREQIENVLQVSRPNEFPGKFTVGEAIPIKSSIAVSSNMYEVTSSSTRTKKYALITRMTSYWGPLAGVFLYEDAKGVTFEGFALPSERIETQFNNTDTDITVKYWKEKALKIFEQTLNEGDEK